MALQAQPLPTKIFLLQLVQGSLQAIPPAVGLKMNAVIPEEIHIGRAPTTTTCKCVAHFIQAKTTFKSPHHAHLSNRSEQH